MLDKEHFIAAVATTLKMKIKKAVDSGSERADRRHKFVGVAYSTDVWSASSTKRPTTDISAEMKNKMAYAETSKEQAFKLPPWNDVTVGNQSRPYKSKPGREPDVPGLRVVEPVNERFAAAFDYRNYRFFKKSSCYDHDIAHELHKMAKKIAAQMKHGTFSGKDPMSSNTFLKEFKSAWDTCRVHKGTAMCLLKRLLTDPNKAAVKKRVAPTRAVKFYLELALKSYSAIGQFILNCYVSSKSNAKLDTKVYNPRQGSMVLEEYAPEMWTRTQYC